jgi:hypothetical protein
MLLVAASLTQTATMPAGAPTPAPITTASISAVSTGTTISVIGPRTDSPADCLHVGWSGCMVRSPQQTTRRVGAYQPSNERLYRYYRNYLIPCLRAAGVETAPLPARKVIERRLAEGYPVWLAYDRNAMVHRGEQPEANPRTSSGSFRHWLHLLLRKCPPLPPPPSSG